jgi:hypothetical protein
LPLVSMGGPKPYLSVRPMFQTGRWRIFVGDMVFVNHGPHKGASGRVLQVIRDRRVPQVVVEGVNLVRGSRKLLGME